MAVLILASGLLHLGLLASLSGALGGHAGRSARSGAIAVARLWEGAEAASLAETPSPAPAELSLHALLPVPPEETINLDAERRPEPAQDLARVPEDQPQAGPGSGAGEETGAGEAGAGAPLLPTMRESRRWGAGWWAEDSEAVVIPRDAVCPKPKYPAEAKARELEGKGELQFEVLADGSVGDIFIAKSTGFPILDQAALESIKQTCKFFPGRRRDQAVSMWVTKPFKFDLEEAE